MNEIEVIRRLVSEANVQLNVLAQYCHCTTASINNYITGRFMPSGAKKMAIQDGLRKYKETINNIIRE